MSFTKRIAICIILFCTVFLLCFGLLEKTKTVSKTVYREEPCVYITKTGKCYHSPSCHYLTNSTKACGLYKAQSRELRACSYCGGKSYETITVEYYEAQIIENTLSVLCISLGVSISISIVVYILLRIDINKANS